MQMSNDNPDLFNQIREQMMTQNEAGGQGEGGDSNPSEPKAKPEPKDN